MCPINLSLLSGKCAQAKERFLVGGAKAGDHPPQLHHTATVAAIPDHLENSGSPQLRIFCQDLPNEADIGIRDSGRKRLGVIESVGFHGNPYRVGVKNEFARNRSDLPVLGVEQVANPGACLLVNHGNPLRR